jgi:hypothetical protein
VCRIRRASLSCGDQLSAPPASSTNLYANSHVAKFAKESGVNVATIQSIPHWCTASRRNQAITSRVAGRNGCCGAVMVQYALSSATACGPNGRTSTPV